MLFDSQDKYKFPIQILEINLYNLWNNLLKLPPTLILAPNLNIFQRLLSLPLIFDRGYLKISNP